MYAVTWVLYIFAVCHYRLDFATKRSHKRTVAFIPVIYNVYAYYGHAWIVVLSAKLA